MTQLPQGRGQNSTAQRNPVLITKIDETKGRCASVFGDFRRLHRIGPPDQLWTSEKWVSSRGMADASGTKVRTARFAGTAHAMRLAGWLVTPVAE